MEPEGRMEPEGGSRKPEGRPECDRLRTCVRWKSAWGSRTSVYAFCFSYIIDVVGPLETTVMRRSSADDAWVSTSHHEDLLHAPRSRQWRWHGLQIELSCTCRLHAQLSDEHFADDLLGTGEK